MKKKICFVITAHNQYTRSSLLLQELKGRADVDLSIVVGGSAILDNYGNVPELLRRDGLTAAAQVHMVLEGGTPIAMAKTTGLGLIEFASVFVHIAPDIVVVRGDRYEVLAATIAAAYLNIPIAHIEGGDKSGTIDESVRHAITKLAHLHFATNDAAHARIVRMGEQKSHVFNVGAPEVELAALHESVAMRDINQYGVGATLDLSKPYIIVMNHPVTTEYGMNAEHTEALVRGVYESGLQAVWFWPNVDAGTDEISGAIRRFREREDNARIRFLKYVSSAEFLELLKNAAAIVGNSSAGIKEASYFGTPTVNIGSRQDGRLRGENVVDVPMYGFEEICRAVCAQTEHGRFPRSSIYWKDGTSKRIAELLATTKPDVQKHFQD